MLFCPKKGLHRNSERFSVKNQVTSKKQKKKKKGLRRISECFSVQNQVISKKKNLRRNSECFSVQKKVFTEIQSVFLSKIKRSQKKRSSRVLTPTSHDLLLLSPQLRLGGLFSFLEQKSASELLKTCYFAYF